MQGEQEKETEKTRSYIRTSAGVARRSWFGRGLGSRGTETVVWLLLLLFDNKDLLDVR